MSQPPTLPTRLVPAGLGRRFAARVIDALIGTGLVATAGLLWPGADAGVAGTETTVVGLVWGVAALTLLVVTGYLPGGRLLGVRQVRVGTGAPAGVAGLVKYLLIGVVSGLTAGIGYLVTVALLARDPDRRGWHDKVSGLIVIDVNASRSATPLHQATPGWAADWTTHAAVPPSATPAGTTGEVSGGAPVGVVPIRFTGPGAGSATSTGLAPAASSQPPAHVGQPLIGGTPWGTGTSQPTPTPGPHLVEDTPFGGPARPTGGRVDAARPVEADQVAVATPDDNTVGRDQTVGATQTQQQLRAQQQTGTRLQIGEQIIDLDTPVVIGRDPVPPATEPTAKPIAVQEMSVSKTHALIAADAVGGVWLHDLHSTNGSFVVSAGRVVRATAGEPTQVTGHEVLLGSLPVRLLRGPT